MDLFEMDLQEKRKKQAPFAEEMRPKTFEEVLGQDDLLQDGGLINRAIKLKRIPSMILYGPPGTGKTTLAELISKNCGMGFFKISAVSAGIKDLREIVEKANNRMSLGMGQTVLFIDEIHRFSTTQQDYLLPFVESGDLILIGATTENPFFAVNKALVSRLTLIKINPLSKEDLLILLNRCIERYTKSHGIKVEFSNEAKEFLVHRAGGDARRLINSFEISVLNSFDGESVFVDEKSVRDNFLSQTLKYDSGDEHFDTISAYIKSMRGSDPDAAVFYLAKMLLSGEDPRFIARRLMIFASEDIGLADSAALDLARNAFYATTVIGMPEVRIILSHATIYMALAPKSNSTYLAIDKAMAFIRENGTYHIPAHLRDAHYSGASEMGVGGYKYPHNYENSYVKQEYLPDEVDATFYNHLDSGMEKLLNDLQRDRKKGVDDTIDDMHL